MALHGNFFWIFILLCSQHLFYAQQTERQSITTVDNKVAVITNNLHRLIKTVAYQSMNGYRQVFKHKDTVVLIQVSSLENGVEKKAGWYYENERLIYSETIWYGANAKVLSNDKLYFHNDCLMAWYRDGVRTEPGERMFREMDTSVVLYSRKILSAARE